MQLCLEGMSIAAFISLELTSELHIIVIQQRDKAFPCYLFFYGEKDALNMPKGTHVRLTKTMLSGLQPQALCQAFIFKTWQVQGYHWGLHTFLLFQLPCSQDGRTEGKCSRKWYSWYITITAMNLLCRDELHSVHSVVAQCAVCQRFSHEASCVQSLSTEHILVQFIMAQAL